MLTEIIFGIVAALGILGGVLASRAGAAKDLVDAGMALVGPLQQRLAALESRLNRVERWAHALAAQVVELGGDPVRLEDVDG